MSAIRLFLPPLLFIATLAPIGAQDGNEIISKWLATNSGTSNVKVNFSQTRTMRTLKVPIRQSGTLTLDYRSGKFRWELGRPTQTIVVKDGGGVLIVRPSVKKYERRSGGMPAMSALARGFPRTLSEFNSRYRVLSVQKVGSRHRIVTRPRSGSGVDEFTFVVEANGSRLTGIEIDLSDGSSVKTSFTSVKRNVSLPSSVFSPSISGYEATKF
ncbi:MAG: outer membrane lipoprotein carrier protein LolA [Verrucomicrobiota bacterium]